MSAAPGWTEIPLTDKQRDETGASFMEYKLGEDGCMYFRVRAARMAGGDEMTPIIVISVYMVALFAVNYWLARQ